jgi:hypothetical protein
VIDGHPVAASCPFRRWTVPELGFDAGVWLKKNVKSDGM